MFIFCLEWCQVLLCQGQHFLFLLFGVNTDKLQVPPAAMPVPNVMSCISCGPYRYDREGGHVVCAAYGLHIQSPRHASLEKSLQSHYQSTEMLQNRAPSFWKCPCIFCSHPNDLWDSQMRTITTTTTTATTHLPFIKICFHLAFIAIFIVLLLEHIISISFFSIHWSEFLLENANVLITQ